MNKLKKTIKGLECLAGMNTMKNNPCLNCGYQECQTHAICIEEIATDALSLLKEQKPQKKGFWINPTSLDCHCSECGGQPEHESGSSIPLYDYCPYCGAKMYDD